MKTVLIAILAVALIGAGVMMMQRKQGFPEQVIEDFKAWKVQYGKNYGADPDTEVYRLEVFYDNYQKIAKHNKDKSQTYSMAQNQFMDITKDEFKDTYLKLQKPAEGRVNKAGVHEIIGETANDVNWVEKGAVTPIKNQGMCGSCWAFSTTGCLEGVSFIWGGKLQSFSEQQLVDCSWSYGNMGCNGGLMDYAFQYVIANGICTEAEYPYKGVDGSCKAKSLCTNPAPQMLIGGYKDVPTGNCSALQNAINTQPISIGVDAESWQFYSGGVFSNCGTSLDHGVLAVGYTSTYWLVKNSWGTTWGMKGYIELAPGNTCGICNTASYAVYKS